jgi:large subunit ribosomal protein L10
MPNARNQELLKSLQARLADQRSYYLIDFTGLRAGEADTLRRNLRGSGAAMFVVKNTLLARVLRAAGQEGLADGLKGSTAVVVPGDDPVAPVKVITEFARTHERKMPVGKGGLLEASMISAADFDRIAAIPGRDQLLSEFVGVLSSVTGNLAYVLEGAATNLVYTLEGLKEARQSRGAQA